MAEITQLLKRLSSGDSRANDELYPLVYSELHQLARRAFASERRGHTLQPTALLHEAYLEISSIREMTWSDRNHFFAMAARVMRRILVSHARAHLAKKRGGDNTVLDLDSLSVESPERWSPDWIAMDAALERLELESPRASQLVELKFFGGMDFEEAAMILKVSSRTLKRDWKAAKAWLYKELSGFPEP